MKALNILILILISVNLFGQRKKTRRPLYFLKAQGALLLDINENNNFKGFNVLNLGWAKYKKKTFQGIDIELIKYNARVNRESVEVGYFRSYRILGEIEHGLLIGPFANFGYFKSKYISNSASKFPYETKCICLGLGPKIDYIYSLNRNIYLNVSTRVSLLDIGQIKRQDFNIFIPLAWQRSSSFHTDFLRNQFQLLIGVGFKL